MAVDQLITCYDCDPPTEWKPAQISGHRNKHRSKKVDSSAIPLENRVAETGEVIEQDQTTIYEPPVMPTVVVKRPKVADGLVPWLSLAGFAVARRNAYDGDVISNGVPPFINALDDVAQQNDSLYRLLEGIQKGDSPNFRLALATLCIVIPILANHRPESTGLRNLVGGLRFMPGQNIPPLPKAEAVPQEVHDLNEQMMTKAKEMFESMSDEDREKVAESITQLPDDLLQKMVDFQTAPSAMSHPESFVSDDGPPTTGD